MAAPDPEPPAQAGRAHAAIDGLSFLDLVYAVPVGDIAVRVANADLGRVPLGDWAQIGVALSAVFLSWIGLQKNRKQMSDGTVARPWIRDIDFLEWRFVQFVVEIAIIAAYLGIGLRLDLQDARGRVQVAPISWCAAFIAVTFGLYFAWDVLDLLIAGRHRDIPWEDRARIGRNVTLAVLGLSGAAYGVARLADGGSAQAAVIGLVLIGLLYGYRVVQQVAARRLQLNTM